METLTANITGKTRRQAYNGRQYLVAPLTMLVTPGVLHGSNGRLLYPSEEFINNYRAWDGVPITRGHPDEPACSKFVLENWGMGFVLNTTFSSGKLRAEGWFDEIQTNKVDSRVINALESGRPIELSTGLYIDITNEFGFLHNQTYDGVARNPRPDHLAILYDSKGACSVSDGCGVNVRNNCSKCGSRVNNDEVPLEIPKMDFSTSQLPFKPPLLQKLREARTSNRYSSDDEPLVVPSLFD